MRVFITGASGHIGSALIPELRGAGHDVVGLARSDAAAAKLTAAGADVLRGDLDDLDGLARAAAAADGVVHLAFKHEAMQAGDFASAIDADLRAVETFGAALADTGKPLIGTSGTLMLAFGGVPGTGTEADAIAAGPRIDAENTVIGLADRGVRSAVLRLPPTVHSSLDLHGFVPTLIAIARERGVAGYVGDGSNRWPAGHTLDVAQLYRLALESAPAGARLHAVDDEGVPFRQIAESIARHVGVPTASVSADEALTHFAHLGPFVGLDNPVSSAHTRELLGWKPIHPRLLDDMDAGHYFAEPAGA